MKVNLKRQNFIGPEEIKEVNKVLKSGILSSFVGAKGSNFSGGPNVKKFEKNIKKKFKVKYALTVNSWTSGLICAVGAIGIRPGDEVILSPWTMSACVSSILVWNAIPIFADIEKDYYTILPEDIEKKITKRTKAIMAIDIFGQSCDINSIKKIAKKYDLRVISDAAQAIGSKYKNKFTGTLTDIGGFSFNYHKHIHTGEGGVILTNNKHYAEKCKLIRNHGESVIDKNTKNLSKLNNLLGFNFRLGEIESVIGIQQLKKLDRIIKIKQKNAINLNKGLNSLKGLTLPKIRSNCTHVFYVYAMQYDENKTRVKKKKIINDLRKFGIPVNEKYENLSMLPIIQKQRVYSESKIPWSFSKDNKIKYDLKNTDILYKNYLGINLCSHFFTKRDISNISKIFKAVWKKNRIM